jgi:hypothetical protein
LGDAQRKLLTEATEVNPVEDRPTSVRLPADLRARIDDYRRDKRISVDDTIIAALRGVPAA